MIHGRRSDANPLTFYRAPNLVCAVVVVLFVNVPLQAHEAVSRVLAPLANSIVKIRACMYRVVHQGVRSTP